MDTAWTWDLSSYCAKIQLSDGTQGRDHAGKWNASFSLTPNRLSGET